MLFGEVAVKWANIVKTQVAETTFENYQKTMNTHTLPVFGNHRIDAITSLDIEVFISGLACGSKTKQNILTPFRVFPHAAPYSGALPTHHLLSFRWAGMVADSHVE